MITMDVTQLELVGGNYVSPLKSSETGNFHNELISSISNELLQSKNIQEIIRKRCDKSNIFEHFADLDNQNYKFLLENLNSLALQVNQFINKLQSGEIKMSKEVVSAKFEELFAEFDQKFGTNLSYDFADATEQLSKFRNYDNVGILIKDAFKLMQNIFEASNEKFPIIDQIQISKFLSNITNDNNPYHQSIIKQLDKLSKLDIDKIINHVEIKNAALRESCRNENIQKQDSIINTNTFNIENNALSVIKEASDNNAENPFEQLPNFKQKENIFSQNNSKENDTNNKLSSFISSSQEDILSLHNSPKTLNKNIHYKTIAKNSPELPSNNSNTHINEFNETIHYNTKFTKLSFENSQNTNLPLTSDVNNSQEQLPNFKQKENIFSQNNSKENDKNVNSIILNNGILRGGSANIQGQTPSKIEQSAGNYTFRNFGINDFVRTVSGFVRTVGGENHSTAKLILEPQWLGTVVVDIVMKNDTAEIKIKARSKGTVEILEQQISSLKEKLQENGITIGRIDLTQEKKDEREFISYEKNNENKKEEQEFLQSFLNKSENSEQDKDDANVGFRLWMQKIIEKYI